MAERTPTDALILGMVVLAKVSDTDHPDHYGIRLAEPARFVSGSTRAVVINKTWHENGRITVRLAIADDTTASGLRECLTLPLRPHRWWRLTEKSM